LEVNGQLHALAALLLGKVLHSIRSNMAARNGLNDVERRKFVPLPVASPYTDCVSWIFN
jgi:hypothetical protein